MKIPAKYSQFLTLLTSLVLLVSLTHDIVNACAEGDPIWEENPQVFMQPDVLNDLRNEPYFFSMNFLNSGKPDTVTISRDMLVKQDLNTASWYTFLKEKVSCEDIYHFLYESPEFVYTTSPKKEDFINTFGQYKLIAYLQQHKRNDVLHYLMLAKANEFPVPTDDWNNIPNYDYYGTDSIQQEKPLVNVTNELALALKQERNAFLKFRYAFQLIRYHRYSYESATVDSLFMAYFESNKEQPLYADALKYACDAAVNMNDASRANYYAARLFHLPNGNKLRAYMNLSRGVPISEVLLHCQSKQEQAMVYVMYAFRDYHPNAEYIKKAVQLDPANTNINDLLVRELNKIDYRIMPASEQDNFWRWINADQDNDEAPSLTNNEGETVYTYPKTKENNQVLHQLFTDLQAMGNEHKQFYTLCLAHLCLIENNHHEAGLWLSRIQEHSLAPKQRLQYHLTAAIHHIKTNNLRQPNVQQQLFENLQYMNQHEQEFYYNQYISNAVKVLAVEKLIEDNDYTHAYLLADDITGIYYSYNLFERLIRPQDIDTIIQVMHRPKTPFERLITERNILQEKELRDIQGSLYLRMNDVVNANKSYALGDNSYQPINFTTLNTNPDGHPCYPYLYAPLSASETEYYSPQELKRHNDRSAALYISYNNYTVTRTILELKDKIKRREGDMASHYYHLASLYMEISYYGRCYQALQFDNSWSWYEQEYANNEGMQHKPYKDHYYGCAWAIPYYQLALKYSKNKELSARCLYALFRCTRHQKNYLKSENHDDINYLYKLHDGYANTAYYRIKECWGISAYVKELRQRGK